MYRINRGNLGAMRKQTGTTLIVTVLLVLLATLLAVFAMNTSLLEQRASGNDVRSRLVQQATEASLSQGIEYFRANFSQMSLDAKDAGGNALWTVCGATDTSFPCGTVPQFEADGVTARRSTMYRYTNSGGADNNADTLTNTLDSRMVTFDRRLTAVGNNEVVNYGTGALLCMISSKTAGTCTTTTATASNTRVLTLVAIGGIAGETARTTLSQSVATHGVVNVGAGLPPFVASGSVDITGGIQVVTNPDSGGPGVPVSIWTREAVTKTGTPNTCYMDDFIRNQSGNASPTYAIKSDGTPSTTIVCDTCNCTNYLSYESSGNLQQMGIDILDVDNVPVIGDSTCTAALQAAGSCKSNVNVKPTEFPCDLFQYVFGKSAWSDSNGTATAGCTHDCFCESRIMTTFTGPDGTSYSSIGTDEVYLYQNANSIYPTTANASKVTAAQKLTSCAQVLAASGLVWDQQGCGIGSNQTMGTIDNPVVLVEDGSTTMQGTLYGVLFVRPAIYNTSTTQLDPATGAAAGASCNGGSGSVGGCLNMNSGAVI